MDLIEVITTDVTLRKSPLTSQGGGTFWKMKIKPNDVMRGGPVSVFLSALSSGVHDV